MGVNTWEDTCSLGPSSVQTTMAMAYGMYYGIAPVTPGRQGQCSAYSYCTILVLFSALFSKLFSVNNTRPRIAPATQQKLPLAVDQHITAGVIVGLDSCYHR